MPGVLLEAEVERQFWLRVADHPDPAISCWLWTGPTDERGYGVFYDPILRLVVRAHRYAYKSVIGILLDGMDVDHLCTTPRCVRHLERVTKFENSLRARLRRLYAARGRALPKGFRTIVPEDHWLPLLAEAYI